jgi:hypothetical protein
LYVLSGVGVVEQPAASTQRATKEITDSGTFFFAADNLIKTWQSFPDDST